MGTPSTFVRSAEEGELPVPGQAMFVAGHGHLMGWGLVVPTDGTAGWAIGALFHHLDGTAGSILYCNEGTADSCDFDVVTVA